MLPLRNKTGILALALALGVVALAPSVSQADYVRGQPIYAQNNTARSIWIAAYYVPAGSRNYVSAGWWEICPGQRVLLLYNNGRFIYFNAHDDQGHVWDGSDTSAMLRGETLKMFQSDTGPCYDPWTISFNPS
jgi:hypothetical protein